MVNNECIRLIDLVRFNEVSTFQEELGFLEFKEVMEFYAFVLDYYKGHSFDSNYDCLKCRAEFSLFILNKNIEVVDSPIDMTSKLHEIAYHNLALATDKSFDLGFFGDTKKYGDVLVSSSFLEYKDQRSFLSKLAQCANNINDRKLELVYCEKMLQLSKSDSGILINYSYALMRNGEYNKARDILNQCLLLEQGTFEVYNQLAVSEAHGNKDFTKAVNDLYQIEFDSIKSNQRKLTIFFNNQLAFSALSGNEDLLGNIYDFQEMFNLNLSGDTLDYWLKLTELCIVINKSVYHIDNSNFDAAQDLLDKVNGNEFGLIKVASFLNSFSMVMKECQKIKSIDDIKTILDYLNQLDSYEVFDDYLAIIMSYFELIYDFYMLLKNGIEPRDFKVKQKILLNCKRNTLTTSEFVNKSLKVIKYINEYKNSEPKSILKENLKNEYLEKLDILVLSPIKASSESSFMYSFSELDNVNYKLCELLVRSINLLQRSEPSFIKNYKSGKTNQLLESDFRDVIYQNFGLMDDVTVSSESNSRDGRTDLQIESKKFGIKTFEFKIWGSNDYKSVVSQIYHYMTDLENEGFVFMINKNKECIAEKYKANLVDIGMGYIDGSLEEVNINGYVGYVSKHKINVKTKSIYHFIYNLY